MAAEKLLMYPSGFKALKLYSQIPTDGTGDFTVSRNSVKTRINPLNVIEEIAAHVPSIDYTDGVCPVLLVEPQSINLITYSEQIDHVNWTNIGSPTTTSNTTIAPDGNLTADKIEDNAGSSVEGKQQSVTIANDSGIKTFTIYILKDNDETRFPEISLEIKGGSQVNSSVQINTKTGALASRIGTPSSQFSIESFGEYWKLTLQGINNSSGNTEGKIILLPARGNTLGGSTSTNGSFIVWGAQLEEQPVATSYIKTENTTVTRLSDVITGAGDSSTFSSVNSSGVLFVEMAALSNDGTGRIITIHDGISNRLILYLSDTSNQVRVEWVSTISANIDKSYTLPLGQTAFNKIAVRWGVGNGVSSVWVNGVEALTDATGVEFGSLITLNLANFNSANNLYAKVKNIKVLPYLTDEQMIILTT